MTTDVDPSLNGHAPDAQQRVLDSLGNAFSAESLRVLAASAISPENAVRYGVQAVAHPDHVPEEIDRYWVIGDERGPGMLFHWRDLGRTVVQFRPDTPVTDGEGKEHKYVLPSGCGTFLSHFREPATDNDPYLFVEGTKQGIAAAVWAPQTWGVVAVPGCNNWVGTDLVWAEDRTVIVLFDKDLTTNRGVYDAAAGLKEALDAEGVAEVKFAKLAGARDKDGLDDVLGRRPEDRRTSYIERICGMAVTRLGRAPARRQTNPYIGEKGLLTKDAALAVLEGQPAALAAGGMIALYRDGAFGIDSGKEPLIEKVKDLLGNDFRPQWRAAIEEYMVGELSGRGLRVKDKESEPLLNCATCMVDLRTGEALPHDPKYLSTLQIPVPWLPKTPCPTYEAWLEDVIPGQAEALEEIAATMLDPSRTPLKSAFLFGPTHSGKSTFLRIMMEVAGHRNTSAVTLHQLSDDRFMSAELYQKMLNSGSDISSAHVDDVSLFKRLTGEDPIQANRKYGRTFTFTNRALFAFSANEIPTVAETSRAYVQRITAFRFGKSFAGKERPEIEEKMIREELPGILARWVASWRRFNDRGMYLPPDMEVQEEFETSSDRVARWVSLRCDVHTEAAGKLVGPDQGDSVSGLYTSFKIWAREDGPANVMSRPKFAEKLRTVPGVGEVRLAHKSKNLGLNVTTRTGEDRERIRSATSHTGQNGTNAAHPAPSVGSDSSECGKSVGSCDHENMLSPAESVGSVGSVGCTPYTPLGETECASSKNDLEKSGITPRVGVGKKPTLPTLRRSEPTPVPTLFPHSRGSLPTPEPTLAGQSPHRAENKENDHERTDDDRPRVCEEVHNPEKSDVPGQHQPNGGSTVPEGRDHPGEVGNDRQRMGAVERLPGIDSAEGVQPEDHGKGIMIHPAEQIIPDPFADYDQPSPGVPVGLDLETADANEIFTYGPGYVRLVGAGPQGNIVTGDTGALDLIRNENPLVGHNLALFDLIALDRHEGIPVEQTIPRAHDLRFAAFQADPPTSSEARPGPGYKHYSLDALGERYLSRPKSDLGKKLVKEYGGWDRIPFGDQRYHDYCADDVRLALALAAELPMTDYDRREMEVAAITARATLEGFRVDVPALQQRVRDLAEQSASGRAMLAERFGFPLHTKDGKSVAKAPQRTAAGKAALEAALTSFGVDLTEWPRGKDGTLSLAKEVMEDAVEWATENKHPSLAVLHAVQELNGLRTNAANLLRCTTADGRVHPRFEPFQAFGRWSVTEPGLTVLKKAAEDSDRIFLLPDEGHVLISFDADQVDIRCVAVHSQDPGLMAIMRDPGRDIHNEVSDMAFGRHDDPYRHHAKSCDLGWLYGRSVNGLANTPGIEYAAAERVSNSMREQFGGVIEWQREVRRRAENRALLDNGFGRHFRCDEGREYTQAPAGHGQSMTRDVVAEGLLTMQRRHPELIPMLRVIVHDEIVMSVPESDAEDIRRMVIQDMTQEISGIPFTWGSSRPGRNWAACYAKD